MDLLFKRYANPYIFLDSMLESGCFDEAVSKIWKFDQEDISWEYFLHKVWDKSFDEFKNEISLENESVNLLIYPLRTADVYILSINGKSEIFSSNQRLYKVLCKKGFITSSADSKALFREYKPLDFQKISRYISNSQIKQIPADDCFISDNDIFFLDAPNSINHYAFIPCLFEDKTVVEAFFETALLTGKMLEEFDQNKLRQITSAFNEPAEIIQEIAEHINF